MANKTISFVVPEDVYNKIKTEADSEYIGLSAYLRRMIMNMYKDK